MLVIHAPPAEIYAPDTGALGGEYGERYRLYVDQVRGVLDAHPHVVATVSGHVHHLATRGNGGHVVMAVGAANEKPHQGRLLTWDGGRLVCRTVSMAPEGVGDLEVVDRRAKPGLPGHR